MLLLVVLELSSPYRLMISFGPRRQLVRAIIVLDLVDVRD